MQKQSAFLPILSTGEHQVQGPSKGRRQDQRQAHSTGPKPIWETGLRTRLQTSCALRQWTQPRDKVPTGHPESSSHGSA